MWLDVWVEEYDGVSSTGGEYVVVSC